MFRTFLNASKMLVAPPLANLAIKATLPPKPSVQTLTLDLYCDSTLMDYDTETVCTVAPDKPTVPEPPAYLYRVFFKLEYDLGGLEKTLGFKATHDMRVMWCDPHNSRC